MEVTWLGQIETGIRGNGFEDDPGDLVGIRREGGFHGFDLVERQADSVLRERSGNTGAVRMAEGQSARASFHEQGIDMAVVTTGKFNDLVTLGKAAREPDRGHGGLGAGVAHSDLLHTRDSLADHARERDFERIRNPEARAVLGGFLDSLNDGGMCMAKDRRPPGADIINVFGAVHVPNPGALRATNEKRLAADGTESAHGGIDTAGDVPQCLSEKSF